MPESRDYRPMHGRSKGHDLADGTHTRVKIDLFPEYIRNLPAAKKALWDVVGRALCSEPVKQAFVRRLSTGEIALEVTFGPREFAARGSALVTVRGRSAAATPSWPLGQPLYLSRVLPACAAMPAVPAAESTVKKVSNSRD